VADGVLMRLDLFEQALALEVGEDSLAASNRSRPA